MADTPAEIDLDSVISRLLEGEWWQTGTEGGSGNSGRDGRGWCSVVVLLASKACFASSSSLTYFV